MPPIQSKSEKYVWRATMLVALCAVALGAFLVWRGAALSPPGVGPNLALEALMGGAALVIGLSFWMKRLLRGAGTAPSAFEVTRAGEFLRERTVLVHVKICGTARLTESLEADNAGELCLALLTRIESIAASQGAAVTTLSDREIRVAFIAPSGHEGGDVELTALGVARSIIKAVGEFRVKGRSQLPLTFSAHAGLAQGLAVIGKARGMTSQLPIVLGDLAHQTEALAQAARAGQHSLLLSEALTAKIRGQVAVRAAGVVLPSSPNMKTMAYSLESEVDDASLMAKPEVA